MKGEMCVLHRTVLKHPSIGEKQFIMRACDSRCPKYGKK
jgi:hypothetical protein